MEKPLEYADRGIPEFWIIDPARGWILVLNLKDHAYQQAKFVGDDVIVSAAIPQVRLTAGQISIRFA